VQTQATFDVAPEIGKDFLDIGGPFDAIGDVNPENRMLVHGFLLCRSFIFFVWPSAAV
jgi:hypothetical protein